MVLQTLCPAEKEDKVNRPRNRRHPWHEAPDPAHPWKLTNHSPPPQDNPPQWLPWGRGSGAFWG